MVIMICVIITCPFVSTAPDGPSASHHVFECTVAFEDQDLIDVFFYERCARADLSEELAELLLEILSQALDKQDFEPFCDDLKRICIVSYMNDYEVKEHSNVLAVHWEDVNGVLNDEHESQND